MPRTFPPLWQYLDPAANDPPIKVLFRDGVPVDIKRVENDDVLTIFEQIRDPDIRFEILRRMRPFARKRVGLAIMRCQPLHYGHELIVDRMLEVCETGIVGIGSAQASNKDNPYNANIRTQMIQNVYGDRVKIMQFRDLGTSIKTNDWVIHVLDKIRERATIDEPTDYFTGSKQDGLWYAGKFYYEVYGAPSEKHELSDGTLRKIHFVDRNLNDIIPATEIRGYLELRDDTWKNYVNPVNHDLVINNYPEQFRVIL